VDLPRKIGRYEIEGELGRGMMGVVYKARDPELGRAIALKTIHLPFIPSEKEREEFEKRFLTEARIAARLSHPGIVVVHDVGRDGESGTLFIALEYLVGRTLADIADAGAMEWREALRIVARVADALDHAHAAGVIHRDIKPANVMVLRNGEPKIMDFGIAKAEAGHLTSPGQLFGTPLFMAPEQALGEPIDARSDIFALGTIAYTLVTGRHPFAASSVPGILARVAHQRPQPPSKLVPALPVEIDYFVERAMAKQPSDRYPTARALGEDAEDILAGRPPRHRAGWKPPETGEGTLVSTRGLATPPEPELVLEPAEPAPPRKRRSHAVRLAGVLLVAAAAYFVAYPQHWEFWRIELPWVEETWRALLGGRRDRRCRFRRRSLPFRVRPPMSPRPDRPSKPRLPRRQRLQRQRVPQVRNPLRLLRPPSRRHRWPGRPRAPHPPSRPRPLRPRSPRRGPHRPSRRPAWRSTSSTISRAERCASGWTASSPSRRSSTAA
jgi:predicted Ser/Thr protein kinase